MKKKVIIIAMVISQIFLMTSCNVCYKTIKIIDENSSQYAGKSMYFGIAYDNKFASGNNNMVGTYVRLALWFYLDSNNINYNLYHSSTNDNYTIFIKNLKIRTIIDDGSFKDSLRVMESSSQVLLDFGLKEIEKNSSNEILNKYKFDINSSLVHQNIIIFIDVYYEPIKMDYRPDGSIVDVEFDIENESGIIQSIKRKEIFDKTHCGQNW